jgi:hypothetical protein
MRVFAHWMYGNFFTNNRLMRITDMPSLILSGIESGMFDDKLLLHDAFDGVRYEALSLLERRLFDEYRRSSNYLSLMSYRRTTMTQDDHPRECVLYSIQSGEHTMHPLYDMSGRDGWQLLLPLQGWRGQ